MEKFTSNDLIDYYNQTENHYRMWWSLEKSMGLHYGIWDEETKSLPEAVLNVNKLLIELGEIKSTDKVLDAGCGIGGSCVYIAQNLKCQTVGITLSAKQVQTAKKLAEKKGVSDYCNFYEMDYTKTSFEDNSFDVVWAIESIGSAPDKELFFKEMRRILKPGGRIVTADTFKPVSYDISKEKEMLRMLNGWAINDIHSISEMEELGKSNGFKTFKAENYSKQIKKSVSKMYWACVFGMIGTKAYNLFYNATRFSKIHYTTGLAQKKTYDQNKWGYYLLKFQ